MNAHALTIPQVPTLEQIRALEREIVTHLAAVECPVTHHFAPGVYAREMKIPKGTVLTGKIHRTEHLNIVSAGDITVWTEEGMKRIQAPYSFVSKPGTKRVGYAHEDTVWTTIHPTEETDLEVLERLLIIPEPPIFLPGESP